MTRIALLALALSLYALQAPVSAQEAKKPPTAEELAEKLLIVTRVDKSVEGSLKQVRDSQAAFVAKGGASEEAQKRALAKINEGVSWDALKGDFITLYATVYSAEELQAIIDFYESKLGQKVLDKQGDLSAKSQTLVRFRLSKLIPEIKAILETK